MNAMQVAEGVFPKPLEPAESRRRLELQIQAMHNKALEAAEARWPGFTRALEGLLKQLP